MSEDEMSNGKKKFVDRINTTKQDTSDTAKIMNDVDHSLEGNTVVEEGRELDVKYETLKLDYSELQKKFEKMQILCANLDNENKSLKLSLERKNSEIITTKKFAISGLLKDIIASFENFEKELLSFDRDGISENKAFLNLLQGADLTFTACRKVFANYGIVLIAPKIGDQYNHEFHNALQVTQDSTKENGMIVNVFQDGYTLHDRLLRPALVAIIKND